MKNEIAVNKTIQDIDLVTNHHQFFKTIFEDAIQTEKLGLGIKYVSLHLGSS